MTELIALRAELDRALSYLAAGLSPDLPDDLKDRYIRKAFAELSDLHKRTVAEIEHIDADMTADMLRQRTEDAFAAQLAGTPPAELSPQAKAAMGQLMGRLPRYDGGGCV